MTEEDFARSLTGVVAPRGLGPALLALWWAGKREWQRAHDIVMGEDDADAAWVQAHLHRVEGDPGNARYWYRRAGQPVATAPLDAEWKAIAGALLARRCPAKDLP